MHDQVVSKERWSLDTGGEKDRFYSIGSITSHEVGGVNKTTCTPPHCVNIVQISRLCKLGSLCTYIAETDTSRPV